MKFDNKNNLFEIFENCKKKIKIKTSYTFLKMEGISALKWEETNQKINSLSNFFLRIM